MLRNQDLSERAMSDSKIEIWVRNGAHISTDMDGGKLGLVYRHQPIEPRTGETQTASYTALNRKQKVPFLVDGEVRVQKVSPSAAIWRNVIRVRLCMCRKPCSSKPKKMNGAVIFMARLTKQRFT